MAEVKLTPAEVENLIILRDYIDALPEEYERFNMSSFAQDGRGTLNPEEVQEEIPCGASCCAIGHAPIAGLKIIAEVDAEMIDDWDKYGARIFPSLYHKESSYYFARGPHSGDEADENDTWEFLFGADWSNDPKQFVERVNMVIRDQIPEVWNCDMIF